MATLSQELEAKRDRLLDTLSSYGSCLVAYSGGVDSALVAKAAQLALGDRAVAITGVSASLAQGELEQAAALANEIGIRHEPLHTHELSSAAYTVNAPDRCFHCKTELYTQLTAVAARLGVAAIASGTNIDDLGDYRPGLAAATNHRIRQPLVDCGITKTDVRSLAAAWDLPVASKPASPCLSSRIAYGQAVTPERLQMIDRAEQHLRSLGFPVCRVRFREGDIASVEVPREQLSRFDDPAAAAALHCQLKELGFREVSIDPTGFRSGSLNEALPLHQIQPPITT